MSEPRFIGLDDFLDFRNQLINNPVNPKSWESFNLGQIPVQTVVNEGGLVPKGWIPRKMWKLFGEKTEELLNELNKELAA